jgi:hypothetical protein
MGSGIIVTLLLLVEALSGAEGFDVVAAGILARAEAGLEFFEIGGGPVGPVLVDGRLELADVRRGGGNLLLDFRNRC